jgi:hypothetical protein
VVAGLPVSELTSIRALFRRQLLNTLAYWQGQIARHAEVMAALDHELANLAHTVEFGLQARETCPEALRLLAAAHDVIVRRGSAIFGNDLLALMASEACKSSSIDESLTV